jgi:hypothetical protein
VNFVDVNGHVHELFFKDGLTSWLDNDLTAVSGGPLTPLSNSAAGVPGGPPVAVHGPSISGYWQSTDQSQHVDFLDSNGDVQELSLHP